MSNAISQGRFERQIERHIKSLANELKQDISDAERRLAASVTDAVNEINKQAMVLKSLAGGANK